MNTFSKLLPGVKVQLDCGVTVTVYPIGFVHMREFAEHVASMLSLVTVALKSQDVATSGSKEARDAMTAAVLSKVAPYVAQNALELVAKCVAFDPPDVTMNDLPHWDVARVLEAWIEQSFGDAGKLQPWAAVFGKVEKTIKTLTGSPTPSSSSSPAVTPSGT